MIIIVAGSPYHNFDQYEIKENDYYIGLESGCQEIIKRGLNIDLAVGDFDHIDNLNSLTKYIKQLIKYPREKDEIDLELAFKYLRDKKVKDEIRVYNAVYGRIDHELITFKLLYQYDDLNIKIISDNEITYLGQKEIKIKKDKRFSLIPLDDVKINITGAKYNLNNTILTLNSNYTSSNYSIIDTTIKIDGKIIIVEENKKGCK